MRRAAVLLSLLSTAITAYDLDYFDRLRTDESLVSSAEKSPANADRMWQVSTPEGDTFSLAQITAFLPFSDGTSIREAVEDDLAATLLAIHHFNNPELSPHLNPEDLADCNIKLTAEFHDTRYSPIDSTRRFTNILQRENMLSEPLPAGVIGAYRSAVTSPLAILTGVNDIPQISYASTSTDFDVKEQYPLFGRTIQSSTGEALVALELFKSLGASHVGVLFVTDAFGSALQKAFQDAASEEGIVTDSVAFSYSADLEGSEIPNAVESLKKTQFKLFYVIAFEVHYESIMKAAHAQGLIGDDFLWIFDGFDSATFHRNAVYPPGSPLALATAGVGLIGIEGGLRSEIQYPNVETVPALVENPETSYEKFRTAWRTTIEDADFEAYARSRMPEGLEEIAGYDPDYTFGLEAVSYTPFLYDAITGLGMAYCRAANGTDNQLFIGEDVFTQFANSDFYGATGRVKIQNDTGTRDHTTELFVLLNAQPQEELDENGNQVYKLVPTDYYESGWKPIENRDFLHAGGSTATPKSLPEPEMEMNYIGNTGRAVGYTLMGIVAVGAIAAFVWLLWFKNERVVRSSQPLFLFMVALGSLVMASSIIPLSLEEPVPESGLDAACMSAPWLYLSGAVIAFSSLLAKTRGVRHAYINPDLDFIHVTSFDIFGTFSVLYLVNFIVLITWQFVAPLEWNRVDRESTDIFDRAVESYGTCSNDDALPFVVVIIILNISILIVANWWAYQARNIETEYHESRYIGISMASILQAWCMGIPILIVVWDNPQAKFFVQAGIIFVTALAVLLLIFVPKMLAIRTDLVKAAEESKRLAYTSFTNRARNKEDFEGDDEEDKAHPVDQSDTNTKEFSDESPEAAIIAAAATFARTESVDKSSEEERPKIGGKAGSSASFKDSKRSFGRGGGLVESISKSMRFSSGALSTDDADPKVAAAAAGGIRVTHNPRSARNLEVSGGREYSRAQLEHLEGVPAEEIENFEEGEEDVEAPLREADEERGAEQGDTRTLSQ
mmetsp:Transcript_30241/g.49973  ORF Transcript_30241/g.49973 Transcript_30241/m.49973 type:complete len:1011 (-) Transcript_30241:1207-4239(-)